MVLRSSALASTRPVLSPSALCNPETEWKSASCSAKMDNIQSNHNTLESPSPLPPPIFFSRWPTAPRLPSSPPKDPPRFNSLSFAPNPHSVVSPEVQVTSWSPSAISEAVEMSVREDSSPLYDKRTAREQKKKSRETEEEPSAQNDSLVFCKKRKEYVSFAMPTVD